MYFIVNPISGTGKQKRLESLLQKKLDLTGLDFDVYGTSDPKDATAIRSPVANKKVPIIIPNFGGGSVNELV